VTVEHLARFLKLAKRARSRSTARDYSIRIGCVIVKRSRVIGVGWNTPNKTHPKCLKPYRKFHAEDAALFSCTEDPRGATAVVYREYQDGSLALSKPCEHCHGVLSAAGIASICYSSPEGFVLEQLT
jgi:deoxycytidylate deaminase